MAKEVDFRQIPKNVINTMRNTDVVYSRWFQMFMLCNVVIYGIAGVLFVLRLFGLV